MPKSSDDLVQQFLMQLDDSDLTEEDTAMAIKNFKTFTEAVKLIEPEPEPEPEPTGFKAFVVRHGSELIRAGGMLSAVGIIAVLEAKGDVIFRSKATKYL